MLDIEHNNTQRVHNELADDNAMTITDKTCPEVVRHNERDQQNLPRSNGIAITTPVQYEKENISDTKAPEIHFFFIFPWNPGQLS